MMLTCHLFIEPSFCIHYVTALNMNFRQQNRPRTLKITVYIRYGWDWVPEIRVPKGNTRTRTKFWVWVGLGLCLNFMGIFGLGTHKVQNFGFFWVLPLGTREDWVPKIWAPKGNTRTVL